MKLQLSVFAILAVTLVTSANAAPRITMKDDNSKDTCWAGCYLVEPICPEDMFPKLFGVCWTCCLTGN
jgi:hypothetical protein